MHTQPLGRQIVWLVGLIILLSGLSSLAGEQWLNPHWSEAEAAWVTADGAQWDTSSERWQDPSGAYVWDESRQAWTSNNGAFIWDADRDVWTDAYGDVWLSRYGIWLDPSETLYWDVQSLSWKSLPAASAQ